MLTFRLAHALRLHLTHTRRNKFLTHHFVPQLKLADAVPITHSHDSDRASPIYDAHALQKFPAENFFRPLAAILTSLRSLRSSHRLCLSLSTHALRAISEIVLRTRLKNLSNPCGTLEVSLRDSQESCRYASTLNALDLIVTKMTNTSSLRSSFFARSTSSTKSAILGLVFRPQKGSVFWSHFSHHTINSSTPYFYTIILTSHRRQHFHHIINTHRNHEKHEK